MFQVTDDADTLTAIVNCDYPLRGGRTRTISFDIEFDRLESTEITALYNAARIADIGSIGAIVKERVIGWTGFTDAKNSAIEFNDENLNQLSRDAALAAAVGGAMLTAANGGAKAKNSSARRGGTQKS